MKLICLVCILGLTAVACQREDEASSSSSSSSEGKSRVESDDSTDMLPGTKSGKVSDRSHAKKPAMVEDAEPPSAADLTDPKRPIPTAEPVPDQPGFVRNPDSGNVVDVSLIPAGVLVAEPSLPAQETRYFRVPAMAGLKGTDKAEAPKPATTVPDKPGFIVNPFNENEFDASKMDPGTVVMDPSSTPDAPRFFEVPSDHIRRKR